MSFLALGPPLNTLIREASIEARSCTVHADSGFESVLCEESRFAELIETSAGNDTVLVLSRGQTVIEKHVRSVQQISLTPDDGQLHLTCYRMYSNFFLGW